MSCNCFQYLHSIFTAFLTSSLAFGFFVFLFSLSPCITPIRKWIFGRKMRPKCKHVCHPCSLSFAQKGYNAGIKIRHQFKSIALLFVANFMIWKFSMYDFFLLRCCCCYCSAYIKIMQFFSHTHTPWVHHCLTRFYVRTCSSLRQQNMFNNKRYALHTVCASWFDANSLFVCIFLFSSLVWMCFCLIKNVKSEKKNSLQKTKIGLQTRICVCVSAHEQKCQLNEWMGNGGAQGVWEKVRRRKGSTKSRICIVKMQSFLIDAIVFECAY